MVDEIRLSKSKAHVKKKLLLGLIAWALALAASAFFFDTIYMKIGLAFFLSVYIVSQEKIRRYWKLSRSNNIEVINAGIATDLANKHTFLPFKIPFFIIIAIAVVYTLSALLLVDIGKILLGLSIIVSISNSTKKEIIFDYDHGFFYGLWKTTSGYDSDRQTIKRTTFFIDEENDAKIKVLEDDEHYFVLKKDYTEPIWERILVNMERVNAQK